ncbi:MAG: hypothetical protein V1871_07270 [Planctomycetota bacterium]
MAFDVSLGPNLALLKLLSIVPDHLIAGGGGGGVVKVRLFPLIVPEELVAAHLKLYRVFELRPLAVAETTTLLVPMPNVCDVVVTVYETFRP